MQVEALDRDERGSVNAELRFSLLEQMPRIPSSQMFSIDSITGEVSLTEEGQPFTVAPESKVYVCSYLNCGCNIVKIVAQYQ